MKWSSPDQAVCYLQLSRYAQRWADIAEIELVDNTMPLENAEVRFVPIEDGRPEGLSAIDIAVNDKAAILEAAGVIDAVRSDSQIYLCGVRINLV